MTCPFDQASDLEQRQRESAIAAQRAEAEAQSAGKAFTHCIDCEDEISEERRQIVRNCRRCVDCEERQSQQDKWKHRSTRRAYR